MAYLPPFAPSKNSGGVDRYGFLSVLAKRCGRRTVPRSFANWIHGWVWAEEPTPELLASRNLPRNVTIVVCQEAEQLALKTAGCKFSFCGPIYSYDESILRAAGFHSLDQLVNLLSESYIREKFSKYFVNHPRMGLVDESFAADSIGEKYIMSPQEIEDALGWTVGGQIKGYATGSRRRLRCSIISRMVR